jgi:hypothetical protein
MEEEKPKVPEVQEVDTDAFPMTNKLKNLHQEGNYLVGVTELGVRFKQHIPVDKILTQDEKGNYKLQSVVIQDSQA